MNEKKMSTKNYSHNCTNCPECKSPEVLYDAFHDQTYCETCGLVIIDNTHSTIITYLETQEYKEHYIRSLWKKYKG